MKKSFITSGPGWPRKLDTSAFLVLWVCPLLLNVIPFRIHLLALKFETIEGAVRQYIHNAFFLEVCNEVDWIHLEFFTREGTLYWPAMWNVLLTLLRSIDVVYGHVNIFVNLLYTFLAIYSLYLALNFIEKLRIFRWGLIGLLLLRRCFFFFFDRREISCSPSLTPLKLKTFYWSLQCCL